MVSLRLSRLVFAALVAAPAVARAGEINDAFGQAMAIDGERVAIAAPDSNVGRFDGGAVAVYRLREGTWRFEQRVTPAEPETNARFGTSVALAGDLLAVGMRDGDGARRAWVFVRGPDGWDEQPVFQPPAGGEAHDFAQVAVDDGWVAIGTPYVMRGGQPEPGEIHLFEKTDSGLVARQVLVGEPGPRRQLGRAFKMARGVLVAPLADGVETWVKDGGAWQREGSLAYEVPEYGPFAEYAFDGHTLLSIEAPDGLMRFYTRSDGGWSAPQTLPAFADADYGGASALFGEWAAVAIRVDEDERDHVRLLHRDGAAWQAATTIVRDAPDESFGAALALNDRWLWVGEPAWSTIGPGEALAYERSGAEWLLRASVETREEEAGSSGCAVDRGGPAGLMVVLLLAARRRRARR